MWQPSSSPLPRDADLRVIVIDQLAQFTGINSS